MRYQIQNNEHKPVFSAPWRWLAYWVACLFPAKWDGWCLVDTSTGAILDGWSRGGGIYLGETRRKATFSHVTINKDGSTHEFLLGQTSYGVGQEPKGGRRPVTIIDGIVPTRIDPKDHELGMVAISHDDHISIHDRN